MKVTDAKRRLLLALWRTDDGTQEDRDRVCFAVDKNSVVYCSLEGHGMVEPPGRLTEAGRELARELAALEDEPRPTRGSVTAPA